MLKFEHFQNKNKWKKTHWIYSKTLIINDFNLKPNFFQIKTKRYNQAANKYWFLLHLLIKIANNFTNYPNFQCTSKFSVVGPSHTWVIDDLLPAFIFCCVRAQVQHLGAEIRLIHDFSPHVSIESSSEIALMFTMLQSAYYNICLERGSP